MIPYCTSIHQTSSAHLLYCTSSFLNVGGTGGRARIHASFLEELLVESAPYAWHASALYHLLSIALSLHMWNELWPGPSAPDEPLVMERRAEEEMEETTMIATVYRNPAPTPISIRSHTQSEHQQQQHLNQLSGAQTSSQTPLLQASFIQGACVEGVGDMAASGVQFGPGPGRVGRSRSDVGQRSGSAAVGAGMATTLGLGPDSSDSDSESSSDELAGALFNINTPSAQQEAFTISGTTPAEVGGRGGGRYRLALDLLLGLLAVALTALHVSFFQLLANRTQQESVHMALLESLLSECLLHLMSCVVLLVVLVYTQSRCRYRTKEVPAAAAHRAKRRGGIAAFSGVREGIVYFAAGGIFLLAFLNVFAVRAHLDALTAALNTLNACLLCAHCGLSVLLLAYTSASFPFSTRSDVVGARAVALVLAAHVLVEVGSALPREILLFGGGAAFTSSSTSCSQLVSAMAIALTPLGSLFHALAALHLSGLFPRNHPINTIRV